ncbi:MAG: hypothetical protein EAX95_01190 [Candidatus Thorarchaeota archaeon]|nr:hypothetical protein [Candidatus Thorarchaeota archaeon]
MPVLYIYLLVIRMECSQRQHTCVHTETMESIKTRRTASVDSEVYDEESAKLRRHLESEKALRQLEHRKTLAMAAVHRMSFIR